MYAQEFRKALGTWATGVSIVTSCRGDQIHGMTVSDFAGVSMDPPLVLFCGEEGSDTRNLVADSGVFAVNLLSEDQQDLSNRFASKKDEHLRFQGLDWKPGPVTGSPFLAGAILGIDCSLVATHESGDHTIYVGRVEAAEFGVGRPLIYYAGDYRVLSNGSA